MYSLLADLQILYRCGGEQQVRVVLVVPKRRRELHVPPRAPEGFRSQKGCKEVSENSWMYRATQNYGTEGCCKCSNTLPRLGRTVEHLQQPFIP